VTAGAKPLIFYTMMALVNPGDEVFTLILAIHLFLSSEVRRWSTKPIVLREENDFRLDVDELKKMVTPKTKVIIVNSPHNPQEAYLIRKSLKPFLIWRTGSICSFFVTNSIIVSTMVARWLLPCMNFLKQKKRSYSWKVF